MDGMHTTVVARGPRDAETRLLEAVEGLIPASPEELGFPVRIVVPSKVLRRHVAAALLCRHGRAVPGLIVQTLYSLAVEILERKGASPGGTADVFWVVCRRLAASEPELASALSVYADGYRAAIATVRDLLDAGFETFHLEPLLEAIEDVAVPAGMKRRAAALVRLAARTLEEGQRLGLASPAAVRELAAETLAEEGAAALPSRAVLVHGFAEVIGTAGDLIERVCGLFPGLTIVDRPPDPAHRGQEALAGAFTGRLIERLTGITGLPQARPLPGPPVTVEAFEAPDRDAELRELARRIRELIDGGVDPGGIGIVVRDLRGWEAVLVRHLERLGIPFSAPGISLPAGPAARVGQLLDQLLENGVRCPADLWLEMAAGQKQGVAAGLVRAVREMGAGTLDALAGLGTDDLEAWRRAARRRERDPVSPEALDRAVRTARKAVAILARDASRRPAGMWAADLGAILRLVEPPGHNPDIVRLVEQLDATATLVPPALPLGLDEWRMLLEPILGRAGQRELGGKGGGVRVLSAMEARGVTFTHLFLAGLVRDVFPRVVREDPLMPDRLRIRLRQDFPDLPVKRNGWTEEAYLFATLLSSAEHVSLSWAARNGEGRPAARSSFVERLILEAGLVVGSAPPVYPAEHAAGWEGEPVRPALEWAILAGLEAERGELETAMAEAIRESRDRAGSIEWPVSSEVLASARRAIVAQREARWDTAGPGPWAGLLAACPEDGTADEIWVTSLEQLARCPWQMFVERWLGVEPPADPLAGLPGLDAALVGSLVHAVLGTLAVRCGGRDGGALGDLGDATPGAFVRPDPGELEALLVERAQRLAVREGIRSPSFVMMLAERARPYVELALALETAGGTVRVAGAEIDGELAMHDGFTLRFRADRVDRGPDGLVLTDYKTGKPLSRAVTAKTRNAHLLTAIARGVHLQAAAYAAAAGEGGAGRYLFLKADPKLDPELREARVEAGDGSASALLQAAAGVLWRQWNAGALFPRVEKADGEGKPGDACAFCQVKEACLVDDSAFRLRLAAWMRAGAAPGSLGPVERAARDGWWLDAKKVTS